MRFFTNPRKPMILALARPDPKKNITTLVKAFGECRPLRELANLVSYLYLIQFLVFYLILYLFLVVFFTFSAHGYSKQEDKYEKPA
jgi:ABC-type multidrug transport system permease subunit